jgi:hypothetical protein
MDDPRGLSLSVIALLRIIYVLSTRSLVTACRMWTTMKLNLVRPGRAARVCYALQNGPRFDGSSWLTVNHDVMVNHHISSYSPFQWSIWQISCRLDLKLFSFVRLATLRPNSWYWQWPFLWRLGSDSQGGRTMNSLMTWVGTSNRKYNQCWVVGTALSKMELRMPISKVALDSFCQGF